MFTESLDRLRLEIINILAIDIVLLIQEIDRVNQQGPETHEPLDEERKFLLCLYLRGYSQESIRQKYRSLGSTITSNRINNQMRNIREGIKRLTRENISDRGALINYLLEYGYKIAEHKANNCLSLGGRYFLPGDRSLAETQATRQFILQNYDLALASFLQLWDEGNGERETLIYLNNSWLLAKQNALKQEYGIASFKLYKIAVVVPTLYNNGLVAKDILKGVATLQLKINLALGNDNKLYYPLAEKFSDVAPFKFNNRQKFGLLLYVAKDDRDLNNPQSDTAIAIQNIDDLMGVIGHYSSEATANALKIYATSNIPLITASAASDSLPGDRERANNIFYRVTTRNEIQAGALASFINKREPEAKLAIMYNHHSDYCCSFKKSFVKNFLGTIVLEYANLFSNNYDELRENIAQAQDCNVNVILLIPDGGIALGSLAVAGSIIRQILARDCWLVGGASLIHRDTLEWVREALKEQKIEKNSEKIIISSPWFPNQKYKTDVTQQFCCESQIIWQEAVSSWREGTAYDSTLILARAMDKFNAQGGGNRHQLCQVLSRFKQSESCHGVTGLLQFNSKGDRLNAPVQLVGVLPKDNDSSDKVQYCFRSLSN